MNLAELERFNTLLVQDSVFLNYARDHELLLQFKQQDTGQESYICFEQGQPGAGTSLPENKSPDVQIYLKSAQFEALLAGKLNPYFAAMNGKIQVEGDVVKATDLLKLLKDLVRVYALVKSEGLA